jgi:hypothetical protein
MIKKLKHIASLLLVLVFLAPTMVKLGHHHDHFRCKTPEVSHFHEHHEKCEICKFEFSIFSADKDGVPEQKEVPSDSFRNNYQSVNFPNHSQFSSLLRAPPVMTIYTET